jgi:hypothetical protein
MFLDQEDNVIAWILDGEGRTFIVADSDPFDMGRVASVDTKDHTLATTFDELVNDFWVTFGHTDLEEVKQSSLQYASLN